VIDPQFGNRPEQARQAMNRSPEERLLLLLPVVTFGIDAAMPTAHGIGHLEEVVTVIEGDHGYAFPAQQHQG